MANGFQVVYGDPSGLAIAGQQNPSIYAGAPLYYPMHTAIPQAFQQQTVEVNIIATQYSLFGIFNCSY